MAARPLSNRIKTLGLIDDRHLLFYAPRNYVDYSVIHNRIPFGEENAVCMKVTVASKPEWKENGVPRMVFEVTDGKTIANIVAFRDRFTWRYAMPGDELLVRAKIRSFNGVPQFDGAQKIPLEFQGGLMPRYKGKRGIIAEDTLRAGIHEMLTRTALTYATEVVLSELSGMSESEVLQKCIDPQFESIQAAIRSMHKPSSMAEAAAALKSIKLLAATHIICNARKNGQRSSVPGAGMLIDGEALKSIVSTLPYTMTNDQKRAAREIIIDLRRDLPMRRLLSGDVGTGKTAVFLIAAMAVQHAGRTAVILTPNVLLAEQVANELARYWPNAPVELVTSGSKPNLKQYADSYIKPILIGTTALIAKAAGWPASLLVIDEQQKMSTAQRAKLATEGTHILEATATCIPRTSALVSHGGMDVSILNQCPVEKKIITRVVLKQNREKLFDMLREIVTGQGQIAIVYPSVVDRSDKRKNVEGAAAMWEKVFPGRVGVMHGKMTDAEKKAAIASMRAGEFSVLVSSSLIEIGIDLPDLKAMVVVHPERYGASQLHQLRGRPARHGGKGYCFLYAPDELEPDTMERLKMLEEISDGFELSERDAELRGFGDLDEGSENQHGVSKSGLFVNIKLTPRDIKAAAGMRINSYGADGGF